MRGRGPPPWARLALAALLLAAGPSSATRAEEPCGTIIIPPGVGAGPPAGITGLHPLMGASLVNQQIAGILYRPLLLIAPDRTINRALSIADRVDTIGDGAGFHVAMKHWQWSDGAPITADDVLYCLELMRKMGETWNSWGTVGVPTIITEFHVDGPYDFTITLASKVNPESFILDGLSLFYPLPRHAWGNTTTDEMWQRQTDPAFFKVVSGPYRLGRFELSRFLTLEANPAYSGPAPHVARIVVNFLEGINGLRALQSNEADIADLEFATWNAALRLPGFQRIKLQPAGLFFYIGLNFRNPATPDFKDVRVRQAMADAIDQKLIISLLYHGSGNEMHGPVPAKPADMLSPDARAGHFPVGYDPDRARTLLSEAGWLPGPDGIRVKDGRRFSFTLILPVESNGAPFEIIQRNFQAVGIDMQISQIAFGQVIALITGDPLGWEAHALSWTTPAYVEGQSIFSSKGVNNIVGYSDPEMDRLTAAISTQAGDVASFAFQDYAAQQQPLIFLPSPIYNVLVRDGIEGVEDFISPLNTWQPEYLRLTGPLACTDAHDPQPS